MPNQKPLTKGLRNQKLAYNCRVSSASEPCPNKMTFDEEASCPPSSIKMSSRLTNDREPSAFISSAAAPAPCLLATPSKEVQQMDSKEVQQMDSKDGSPTKMASFQSTPVKLASTPPRVMSTTPALHPTKRCYRNPDDDSAGLVNKLVRHPWRTKSLIFDTPVNEIEDVSADDDILSILPESP